MSLENKATLSWKPDRLSLAFFLIVSAVSLIASGLASLIINGFSPIRLLIFVFFGFLSCLLIFFGWKIKKETFRNNSKVLIFSDRIFYLLCVSLFFIFTACWWVIWTPAGEFGHFYYYIVSAVPYFIWAGFNCIVLLILVVSSKSGIKLTYLINHLKANKKLFIISLLTATVISFLSLLAYFRVVGMKSTVEDFWYGAGVPILAFQVYTSLLSGIFIAFLCKKLVSRNVIQSNLINITVFFLIWIITAWLWSKEPVKPDFLISAPVAPNFEMYPDYDARNYDLMSQFALIGQGINNHSLFDRVLYPAFLTYLHSFAGQNYDSLMAIQSSLFAVFPALLFLIGTNLYNQRAGIAIGVLSSLRGINSINIGNIIETAHQKQMLTEYPTAILLTLATLLLIIWAKNPSKNWKHASLSGVVIGLSTLLRPHTLIIIPLFLLFFIWEYRKRIKNLTSLSTLFILSALLGIIPWVQFGSMDIAFSNLYLNRIEVIIHQRYPSLIPVPINPTDPSPITTPKDDFQLSSAKSQNIKPVWLFTLDNMLNNLVTSIQFLPNSPYNIDAKTVVKKTDNFWKPYWDGGFKPWATFLIPINLLLIALGVGTSLTKAKITGVLPLLVLFAYYLINSLGRTSGGRYLVPVDWVVIIYYILGIMFIFDSTKLLFFQPNKTIQPFVDVSITASFDWKGIVFVLLFSLGVGFLIPISEKINPRIFEIKTTDEKIRIFSSLKGNNSSFPEAELHQFLSTEKAVILIGRSLYPRQLKKGEGLDISVYSFYHSMPYPRTIFTLIGPDGKKVIILPTKEPPPIANATDTMVIGCRDNGFILAQVILIIDTKVNYQSLLSSQLSECK